MAKEKIEKQESVEETVAEEIAPEAVEQTEVTEEVPVVEETPAPEPVVEEVVEQPKEEVVSETPEEPVVEAVVQEEKPAQPARTDRPPRPAGPGGPRRNDGKRPGGPGGNRPPREQKPKEFDSEVISLSRVTKVNKGGRHFRFSATVAVGDRKGRVGIGTGKANEVPDAIKKAEQSATKSVMRVSIVDNRTIPHEAIGVQGASKVLLKPASKGTGVKAGGPVRAVLELAGVKDILSKSLGSSTKINMAFATLEALKVQKTKEKIAALRGKKVEEI